MKANQIKKVLVDFLNDVDNYRTLLLTGPWGCGKTYQIKQAIEETENKDIFYLSLFGLHSIKDIYDAIYKHQNKLARAEKIVSLTLAKLLSPAPYYSGVGDALEYAFSQMSTDKVKRKTVLVLDDVERCDLDSYRTLMGYIHKLRLSGVKVIAICAEQEISNCGEKSNNRLEDYYSFKEKTFDHWIDIDEDSNEIYDSLFEEFHIEGISSIFPAFRSNIRLAERTKSLLTKVLSIKTKQGKINEEITDLILTEVCAHAVSICASASKNKSSEDNKKITNLELIQNELNRRRDEWQFIWHDVLTSEDLLMSVIRGLINDNWSFFVDKIKPLESYDFSGDMFYFLSEEHKKIEYQKFLKTFSKCTVIDSALERMMLSVIQYRPDFIKDEDLDLYVEKYFYKPHDLVDEKLDELVRKQQFIDEIESKDKYRLLYQKIAQKELSMQLNLMHDCIKQAERIDYKWFDNYLLSLRNRSVKLIEDELKDLLIENDFYLPDLSKDITPAMWDYCHTVATFACDNDLKNQFIKVAKTRCHEKKDDKTINERFKTLIIYRLGQDISEDELCKS